MNKLTFLALFCISIISSTPLLGITPLENSKAYALKDELWQNFRQKFPYHVQTIGVLPQLSDGSTLIIVSEPPPHTDSVGFTKFFSSAKILFEVKKQPIGVDGWVKDVVIVCKGINRQELDKTLALLHRYMFFTDYKAEYMDLSNLAKYNPNHQSKLNFDITALEFEDWLFTKEALFYPIYSKKEQLTLQDIFEKQLYGVFLSAQNNFVLWVMPKHESLFAFKPEIRQFTLESDLILGSVASPKMVAIIGKPRTTSLWALQPLRIESILSLAATKKTQLFQSYERKNPFAGKLSDHKDWAPIALSDDIINTEFGSLLNITDQMLKSWSENGSIEYQGFEKFEKPTSFLPFIHKLIKSNSVTYNWNTQGFVSPLQIAEKKLEIVTTDKTGCLPLSYFPNGKVQNDGPIKGLEEKGRAYFSGLNNAYLSRVVSYTFLFQIFSMYDITANVSTFNQANKPINPLIEKSHIFIAQLKTVQPRSTHYAENILEKIKRNKLNIDTLNILKKRNPKFSDTIQTVINSENLEKAKFKRLC
jgi:hypothetical protein